MIPSYPTYLSVSMQNQTRFTFIITTTVSRSALYHRIFQPQKAADTSPTNLLQLEPTNLQSKKINIIFDNIIRVFRKANFSVLKKVEHFFDRKINPSSDAEIVDHDQRLSDFMNLIFLG